MTARILVVDDVPANIRLLEARLQAEYFDVRTASSGREALDLARSQRVDLVLLDVVMPDMSGFEVCRQLKSDPHTAHVPVVMVTALDESQDRVRGLECGADDFLSKPVDEVALVTRVKSLVRLKLIGDELMLRVAAMKAAGLDAMASFGGVDEDTGRILVVDDQPASVRRIEKALADRFDVEVCADSAQAAAGAAARDFDLLIVSLSLQQDDGLRLCSSLRALDRTRQTPILLVTDPDETSRLLRGLDLGVNDYIIRPIDGNELLARVRTQLRRKLYADRLRDLMTNAVELAVTDPLTGLYNRRYLETHLRSVTARAASSDKPAALLIFDIDCFKDVNDTYGHDAGDDVLCEFSRRLLEGVRGIDLVARYGGEEFIVVMPETDASYAATIAERLRRDVETIEFTTRSTKSFPLTVSIGVSEFRGAADTAEELIRRADEALYAAKRSGRNRVVAYAA